MQTIGCLRGFVRGHPRPISPTRTRVAERYGIMRSMQYDSEPSEDELAAAIAAASRYLEQENDAAVAAPAARAWHAAGAIEAQRLPATRAGQHRTWAAVERAARA